VIFFRSSEFFCEPSDFCREACGSTEGKDLSMHYAVNNSEVSAPVDQRHLN